MFYRCGMKKVTPVPAPTDINWSRTLVNEWDFTQSLNSKTGNSPFVIESGATRDENGITLLSSADRVKLDMSTLGISNFTKIDVELDLDWSLYDGTGTTREIFAVYNGDWDNYSAGLMLYDTQWKTFLNNRKDTLPVYGGTRLFDTICVKIEPGVTTYYGMGYYINKCTFANGNIGDYLSHFAATKPYFYLGSGYSDYGITKLRIKKMRIYQRAA